MTNEQYEMLARFIHDCKPPTSLSFEKLVAGSQDSMRRVVQHVLNEDMKDVLAPATKAALRLMLDAYALGAKDMKDSAVSCLETITRAAKEKPSRPCEPYESDDHGASALQEAAVEVLGLPLPKCSTEMP